jgi:predicted amidohydrolase
MAFRLEQMGCAFLMPWGPVGIPICYDLRFPELFRAMALAGAALFLVPAQWPVTRLEAWLTLARARAIENELFVAACNRVGTEGETVFPGRSCVVGSLGQVLAEGDGQEQLLVAQLDLCEVKAARCYLPVYGDRRPEAYRVELADESWQVHVVAGFCRLVTRSVDHSWQTHYTKDGPRREVAYRA